MRIDPLAVTMATILLEPVPVCGGELPAATQAANREEDDASARRRVEHEITGRVVKIDPGAVYLEHTGAVVALEITKDTEFSGLPVQSSRGLMKGQLVMVRFAVEGDTRNVARSISATTDAAVGASQDGERTRTPGVPAPVAGSGTQGTPPRELPVPLDRGPAVPPRDPGTPPPVDPGATIPPIAR
jgi:hypothetical protein